MLEVYHARSRGTALSLPELPPPPLLRLRPAAPLRERLRALLARDRALLLPGTADAITARLIEQTGFEACYVTGGGVANAQFGIADVGLVSQAEVVEQARRVCATVELPVVVDADTGYGNAMNVMRTVAELERAGVAAIQLEDQVTPKRCGHFAGKEVIPIAEMVAKIHAARDARYDPGLVLIARTDALQGLGVDEAIARGRAYRDAGADVIFVEAPQTIHDLRRIPREIPGVPHVVNVVEGGVTPVLTRHEYEEMGFRVILHANLALRAAVFAVQGALEHLLRAGDSAALRDRILDWSARQDLVHLGEVRAIEARYATDGATRSDRVREPSRE